MSENYALRKQLATADRRARDLGAMAESIAKEEPESAIYPRKLHSLVTFAAEEARLEIKGLEERLRYPVTP